ncbi:hypothetical protein ACFVHW_25365 [Streptomyces sp. NPDC127110]|uniref:hypothetical protein n=1 Tax=Streptomyces sp. NPDC127110 TaxID=3345362 RepID=UPI003644364D
MNTVDEMLERAAGDEGVVDAWLGALARNSSLPASVLARLLEFDELPVWSGWLTSRPLDREMTELLVASADIGHRLAVLHNGSADVAALAPLAHDETMRIRRLYALLLTDFGRTAPLGVAEVMAVDPEAAVRRSLLFNPGPAALVQDVLVDDADPVVRALMAKREVWELLSDPVRARLRADTAPEVREAVAALDARPGPEPDPEPTLPERPEAGPHADALRRARDPDVEVRRTLASQPGLPADVQELLAADEDLRVRENLCLAHADAPHDLVVELYAMGIQQTYLRLRDHPNLAGPGGLARYAGHPDPRLRYVSLDDPAAGPELLLRLADDPDPRVANRAVADRRFPADELLRRLTVPAHAGAAARNRALPPAVMHRLVDLARDRRASAGH